MRPFPVTASTPQARDRILDILAACPDFTDVRRAGLLFHGTCEAITGPLHGGAHDGVFWCAETPSVAQTYIPRAGVTRYLSMPGAHRGDEPVRPTDPDDPVMIWALGRAGATWPDLEVERDPQRARTILAWRNLPEWPVQQDLGTWIADELGYGRPSIGTWSVLCDRDEAGQEIFRPADWFLSGTLLVVHVPDLRAEPAAWSPELTLYKPHNRLEDFARFAREGLETFSMQDRLQSDHLGNVGHRAVGLLAPALERADWIAIPAQRHDGENIAVLSEPMTREFSGLMRYAHACRSDPSPSP